MSIKTEDKYTFYTRKNFPIQVAIKQKKRSFSKSNNV